MRWREAPAITEVEFDDGIESEVFESVYKTSE